MAIGLITIIICVIMMSYLGLYCRSHNKARLAAAERERKKKWREHMIVKDLTEEEKLE
jgi:septation ring formation regulator EzrA